MIEHKEIQINGKTFILDKFPAIPGREIISGYPLTAVPKFAEYKQNEQLMLKLMSYVSVREGEALILLSTAALVNKYTGDWETLMKLEKEMITYNCSFFQNGEAWSSLKSFALKLLELISKTSMGSSVLSSLNEKPQSTSSEQL